MNDDGDFIPCCEVDAKGGLRVDLGSAGFITLTLDANLSTLDADDRAFVLGMLERFIHRSRPQPS